MPYGKKISPEGQKIDFNHVYSRLIRPAVAAAGLDPVRSDTIERSGYIHRRMIEAIYRADAAVVDISFLNANVFYELGIRHSLRRCVTVLVRAKGTSIPFNIQSLDVIEYDPKQPAEVIGVVSRYLRNGIKSDATDSLVHEILDLTVLTPPVVLRRRDRLSFRLKKPPNKKITIVAGDIRGTAGIDVWVNSENTNMQMARFFDGSISAIIRYLGSKRDATGNVVEDTIAEELAKVVRDRVVVPGTVVPTQPGELRRTHKVKWIFHAASVMGVPGKGYTPIVNIESCVSAAMAMADERTTRNDPIRSILFPLMGSGGSRVKPGDSVFRLIEAAVLFMEDNPDCAVREACFLAYTERDWKACMAAVDRLKDRQGRLASAALQSGIGPG